MLPPPPPLIPDKYQNLETIIIKHYKRTKFETWVMGKSERLGYWNKPAGAKRFAAAIVPTTWVTAIMVMLLAVIHILQIKLSCKGMIFPLDGESAIGLLAIIAAAYGGFAFNERSSLHQKWQYLASLFNTSLQMDAGPKCDHILACLAHDILTMEMWAHSSFALVFKDELRFAVYHHFRSDYKGTYKTLSDIADHGINYSKAVELIEAYSAACSVAVLEQAEEKSKSQIEQILK